MLTITCQCHMYDKQNKKRCLIIKFFFLLTEPFELCRQLEYTSKPSQVLTIKILTNDIKAQNDTIYLIDFTCQRRSSGGVAVPAFGH